MELSIQNVLSILNFSYLILLFLQFQLNEIYYVMFLLQSFYSLYHYFDFLFLKYIIYGIMNTIIIIILKNIKLSGLEQLNFVIIHCLTIYAYTYYEIILFHYFYYCTFLYFINKMNIMVYYKEKLNYVFLSFSILYFFYIIDFFPNFMLILSELLRFYIFEILLNSIQP